MSNELRQILGVLPILPLVFAWLAVRKRVGNRRALLRSAIAWGTYAILLTELLGLFRALTDVTVTAAWLLACLIAVVAWLRTRSRHNVSVLWSIRLNAVEWLLVAGIAGVLLATLLTALFAPPNNWDAMTYHMARVVNWIQDRSLAHYPTTNLRQLHQAPGAEILILQFQILRGDDAFANLVQWAAFAGSVAGASLVAQQLGAGRSGQFFAAVFCATLPMAILQASNAQNDLVPGFWLICFVSALLRASEPGTRAVGPPIVAAGLSLGLAVVTKSTAYLFAFPFCVRFAVGYIRRFGRRALPAGAVIAALMALLNFGHGIRNARLYGSPLGPGEEVGTYRRFTYTNDHFTAAATVSNVLRNLAVELQTPSEAACAAVAGAVTQIHRALGWDPSDPATTWPTITFGLSADSWAHSDNAGNPWHLLILVGVLAASPMWRRRVPAAMPVLICIVAGFLLFCVVLRWQPWHARLLVPLFMLAAGAVGAVLGRSVPHLLGMVISGMLLLLAWPPMVWSATHPWTGAGSMFVTPRFDQYFQLRTNLVAPYRAIGDILRPKQIQCVGVEANNDEFVYPLWVVLLKDHPELRIEEVGVKNESANLRPTERCQPDVIVVLKADAGELTVKPPETSSRGN